MRIRKRLHIDANNGEVICPKCNGGSYSKSYKGYCNKCNNTGKVFWIDTLVHTQHSSFWFGDSIVVPIIRTVYPKLVASELVSVQPLTTGAWSNQIWTRRVLPYKRKKLVLSKEVYYPYMKDKNYKKIRLLKKWVRRNVVSF